MYALRGERFYPRYWLSELRLAPPPKVRLRPHPTG